MENPLIIVYLFSTRDQLFSISVCMCEPRLLGGKNSHLCINMNGPLAYCCFPVVKLLPLICECFIASTEYHFVCCFHLRETQEMKYCFIRHRYNTLMADIVHMYGEVLAESVYRYSF